MNRTRLSFEVVVLALSLMAALLAGCSSDSTDAAKAPQGAGDKVAAAGAIKIGYIVKQPEEPWFQLEWRFAEQAAKDCGFELIKIGGTDGEKVLAAIDNLAANKAQGFVICTPDVRLGPAIAMRAKQNNLKFMSVDDQFIGGDGKPMTDVYHLGISAYKIGRSVGDELMKQMKERGWKPEETGLCAVTFDELETIKERTDGAIDAVTEAGFPKDRIFKATLTKVDVEAALNSANALLTKHPEIKRWLICGGNDSSVMGAVRATEGQGLTPKEVCGIGINGTDCIVEFERESPTGFYASVLLAPKAHGYGTAEMVYKWVKDGVEPPKNTLTLGTMINRENFKQVLKEQGIQD